MQKHEMWLEFAEIDLKTAKIIFSSPEILIPPILYHTQQCAEKSLKGSIIFKRSPFKKTHDLIELLEMCYGIDDEFRNISSRMSDLNPFSTDARYPESYYPMLDTVSAEQSISPASEVLKFVKDKIELSVISSIEKKEKQIR